MLYRVHGGRRKSWATKARDRTVADRIGGGGLGPGDADLSTAPVTGIATGALADDADRA